MCVNDTKLLKVWEWVQFIISADSSDEKTEVEQEPLGREGPCMSFSHSLAQLVALSFR